MSRGIYDSVNKVRIPTCGRESYNVDNALSTSSQNAVENRIITAKINLLNDALEKKQDVLTFDTTPTSGSNNPVKSGGVYTALTNKVNTSAIANNLTTTAAGSVLDARQGKILKDMFGSFTTNEIIAANQASSTVTMNYGRVYLVVLNGNGANGSNCSVYIFCPGYSTSKLQAIYEGANKATVDDSAKNKLNFTWGVSDNGGGCIYKLA